MFGQDQHVDDSIRLDLAYLKREVPAVIESLAQQSIEEVENRVRPKRSDGPDGDAGRENDASVVRGQTGGANDAGGVDDAGPEPAA